MAKKFPFYKQPDSKDCGATCLKIIAKHYKKTISLQKLRLLCETTRSGSSLLNLSEASEKIGFKSLGVKIPLTRLYEAPLPLILHWNRVHYVVLYKIKKGVWYVSDPGHGLLEYNQEDFLKSWIGDNVDHTTEEGIALLLEPTPIFFDADFTTKDKSLGFTFLSSYLFRYKSFILQLIFGLLAGSLLQLIFPFLTQSIVDVGIKNQDINFIYLILIAQLFLFPAFH